MSATVPVHDDEAREEAIERLRRKRKFDDNAIAYVAVNCVLWLIWALTDRSADGGLPWPAWVSLLWGFFLAMDAWRTFGRRPITEDEIEREVKRYR